MSQILQHFAGDVVQTTPLPHKCKWVRVTDFEQVGLLRDNALISSTPLMGGTIWTPTIEMPTVRLDNRKPQNVYGLQYWAILESFKSQFTLVELQGNIEVEVGEEGDVNPGPLVRGPVDSTAVLVIAPDLNDGVMKTIFYGLPKGTRNVSLFVLNSGPPQVVRLQVSPVFQWQANQGAGVHTGWQPGPTWFPRTPTSQNTASNLPGNQTPILDIVPALPVSSILVELANDGVAHDDLMNNVYHRPWTPAPSIEIGIQTNNVAGPTSLFIHCTS